MIPLSVDVPMKRVPWVNWVLILATVLISVAVPAMPDQPFAFIHGNLAPAKFSPLVLQRQHFAIYQLVTALFQHADLLHLAGNMLFLFMFGNAINAKLGHLGFLASYLGIGILESLVWLVIGSGTATLGASAAIMGLCGMFMVFYPLNAVQLFWDELGLTLLSRSWTGELPGWAVVLIYMAFDLWGAVFERHAGIGYISHLIGAVSGIALAIVLLLTGMQSPDRGEKTLLQWLGGDAPAKKDPRTRTEKRKIEQ